jgi:hypothetical protein
MKSILIINISKKITMLNYIRLVVILLVALVC